MTDFFKKAKENIADDVNRIRRVSALAALFTVLAAILVFILYPEELIRERSSAMGTMVGSLFFVIFVLFLALSFFANKVFKAVEEKQQMASLAESSMLAIRQLRSLLDSIGDAVFAVDEKGVVVLVNNTATKMLSVEIGDLIGAKIEEIIPTIKEGKDYSVIKKVFSTKKAEARRDLEIVLLQKTIKLYTHVAPVVEINGKFGGAIVLARDITEEKEIEERKSEFVAIASHELRTPLAIIEGHLYTAINAPGTKIPRAIKGHLERSYISTKQLMELVSKILGVARAENNQVSIDLKPVRLTQLISGIALDFQEKARAKQLALKFINKGTKNIKIITDENLLTESLKNLIDNAIKYTESGEVSIVLTENSGKILIEVSDTGIGISPEAEKLIFTRFYQAGDWQTRVKGGVGLGLYITKTFIERLGGKISIESKEGKGSKFSIILPQEKKLLKVK